MKSSVWNDMEMKLRKDLTDNRFRHTLGVTYTSCALAMTYGADLTQARTAGLLHDCAKCIPNSEKITLCKKEKIPVSSFEIDHPVLLHAKLGSFIARKKYGITDTEILEAINWHTTGKPAMTLLEKIVFTADYIEPNRETAPNLDILRSLAFHDLDRCVSMILKDTVEYLEENPKSMDQMTLKAYKYYQNLTELKEK